MDPKCFLLDWGDDSAPFVAKGAGVGAMTPAVANALLAVDSFVVLGWVLYSAATPSLLRRHPMARLPTTPPTVRGRVSVIIPARNEEQLLPRCLDSIRAQRMPVHEIIVVDDESTDATPRLAAERGAHVVPAGSRPTGWAGKPWAAHVGSKAATGDWLLFVDADAVLAPDCIGVALAEADEHASDLLSFMPRPTCSTTLEAIGQPFFLMMIMVALDMGRVNDPKTTAAAAWGGFLLFRRSAYEAIGGHVAVQNEVLEDLMLARAIKGRGLKLRALSAPDLVDNSREQPAGRAFNAGWRLAKGSQAGKPLLTAAGAAVVVVWFVGPYLVAPFWRIFAILAAVHLACMLFVRDQLWRNLRLDRRFALLQPLVALLFAMALLMVSLASLGPSAAIRWQGRKYPG